MALRRLLRDPTQPTVADYSGLHVRESESAAKASGSSSYPRGGGQSDAGLDIDPETASEDKIAAVEKYLASKRAGEAYEPVRGLLGLLGVKRKSEYTTQDAALELGITQFREGKKQQAFENELARAKFTQDDRDLKIREANALADVRDKDLERTLKEKQLRAAEDQANRDRKDKALDDARKGGVKLAEAFSSAVQSLVAPKPLSPGEEEGQKLRARFDAEREQKAVEGVENFRTFGIPEIKAAAGPESADIMGHVFEQREDVLGKTREEISAADMGEKDEIEKYFEQMALKAISEKKTLKQLDDQIDVAMKKGRELATPNPMADNKESSERLAFGMHMLENKMDKAKAELVNAWAKATPAVQQLDELKQRRADAAAVMTNYGNDLSAKTRESLEETFSSIDAIQAGGSNVVSFQSDVESNIRKLHKAMDQEEFTAALKKASLQPRFESSGSQLGATSRDIGPDPKVYSLLQYLSKPQTVGSF